MAGWGRRGRGAAPNGSRTPVQGREVPDREAVKELCRRAHRALGVFCVVGWDVGILPDGPCLLEGNHGPCLDSTQRMLLRPIGNQRFGRLLAHHLRIAGGAPLRRRPRGDAADGVA